MRWQHRTAAYNGIGNDNNRNTYRNNTAYNGGRADRERKRVSPDRERGSGNRADCDRHRTDSNGKAKGKNQAFGNNKPTESSAAENTEPKKETPPKTEEPQEEIYAGIQWPEVDPADIERLAIEKVNAYRIVQGDTAATVLPGLTEVARYRANELTINFEHRGEQHVSTELKYGQFIDLATYGMPDDSYYKGYSREAIGTGDWFGTAESMAERIASGFRNSQKHWSYVGGSEYKYIAVGVVKANDKWYVCILMSDDNYGG